MAETSLDVAGPSTLSSAPRSARASRPGSRPRALSPQTGEPAPRKRSPNDVRIKPASPDVISNLISSFPAISFIPDDQAFDDEAAAAPYTPQKRSRAGSIRRGPDSAVAAPPDPTSEFAEYKYPSRDIVIEPTAPEDAAEPPVVRTSRRPSANTVTTLKPFRQYKSSDERPGSSSRSPVSTPRPLGERFAPPSAWNYMASGQQSPMERASLDTTKDRSRRNSFKLWSRSSKPGSRVTSGTSTPQIEVVELRTDKKAVPVEEPLDTVVPPHALPPAALPPAPPTSEPDTESVTVRPSNQRGVRQKSSAGRQTLERARIDDKPPPGPSLPGPSSFQKRYSSEQIFQRILSPPRTPSRPAEPATSARDIPLEAPDESPPAANLTSPAGNNIIPNRNSSLIQSSDLASPEEAKNEVSVESKIPNGSVRRDGSTVIDGEESDALRRVRELKAAKEERRKSLQGQSQPDMAAELAVAKIAPDETVSVSPLRMNPPESTRAAKQLEATEQVTEQTVLVNTWTDSSNELPRSYATSTTLQAKVSPSEANGGLKETATGAQSLAAAVATPPRTSNDGRTKSLVSTRSVPRSKRVSIPGSPQIEPSTIGRNSARPSHDVEQRESLDEVSRSVAEFLAAPRLSQHLFIHEEERSVTFSEVGDPNGYVVFCCVGMGLTRFITAFYDELATSLNLRLITPDRPGIGQSTTYVDGYKPPLSWPDDVRAICMRLQIRKFSLLAHSAGAIYALATALRMPQHIHGKIHLLAPWIPPSQMSNASMPSKPAPTGSLPRSQRLLRLLPTSFFKLSNSSFMNSSLSSRKSSASPKQKNSKTFSQSVSPRPSTSPGPAAALRGETFAEPISPPHISAANFSSISVGAPQRVDSPSALAPQIPLKSPARTSSDNRDRQKQFDAALTPAIWELATRNANPAVDLIVCLERNQPIGFRYADVSRAVVIHHGSKDTRVPVENVKWLGKAMRRAEVRVLDGEGHGLMARAGVMGGVLTEMGKEWEEAFSGRRL